MQFRQYPVVWLASALIVALTGQTSIAFDIIPAQPGGTRSYNNVARYASEDGIQGITWLDSTLLRDPFTWLDVHGGVTKITRGGTIGFRRTLEKFFPDWTFSYAMKDLEGSFEILDYYACGTETPCGREVGDPEYEIVGSHFYLKYHPGENDPYGDNVHWIQRVRSNYTPDSDITDRGPFDFIDIGFNQPNPYYDYIADADTDHFRDTPYSIFAQISHYFTAETYLVEEIGLKQVIIYNGVRWGWKNGVIYWMKTFSDSLASGQEIDNFRLGGLTPGAEFYTWINNDIPANRCNPNTYLNAYSDLGDWLGSDNDSSPVGDGFASALVGTVPSNGIINLTVNAANGGLRGEDRGNYELYIGQYNEENPLPSELIVGGSGGGGVTRPRPGTPNKTLSYPQRPLVAGKSLTTFLPVAGMTHLTIMGLNSKH